MKKFFITTLLYCCLSPIGIWAQVGLMTNNPDKNAALDLNNSDGTNSKGLLLPRVALTATDNPAPLSAHVAGMTVYNTATSGTAAVAVTPGEYYNDGTQWVRTTQAVWQLDGNTNGSLKSIGTNDTNDLPFVTNETEKMRIRSGGQTLINTDIPLAGGSTAKLQLNNSNTAGALQIQDGTQAAGKVLTSDGNGLAKWDTPGRFGSWTVSTISPYDILGFNTSPITPIMGTTAVVAGDEIGLISSGGMETDIINPSSVTVPAGRYLVFIEFNITGAMISVLYEIGQFQLKTATGTTVYTKGYDSSLHASFVLDTPTAPVTLQCYFNVALFPSYGFFMVPPFTGRVNLKLSFLKI